MFQEKAYKILLGSFYAFFFGAFFWISSQLFFETQTNILLASVKDLLENQYTESKLDVLRIVYPEEALSLEPTLFIPNVRDRLANIYEPLVRPDRDLKITPGLAISWGLIDNLTWEFSLRQNVFFHDGTVFDVQDAVASLQRASSYPESELKALIHSIDKIEIIDDFTFRIRTKDPDPLLLQRLSTVLVIPSEYRDVQKFAPVGTGSYSFESWDPGNEMILRRFDNYWGEKSKFKEVNLYVRADKSKRVNMLLRGEVDFLTFVPFDAIFTLSERNFEISSIPSLEVQFLLFNQKSPYFSNVKNRRAFSLAIDQSALINLIGQYGHEVNQFVSNGVFGFNPQISAHEYDLEQAEKLFEQTGMIGKTIHLHLPMGLDTMGEHVREQLGKIGVNVVVSYLDDQKLEQSYAQSKGDIYFFGYKADLGDSADLFTLMVHSSADFNIENYSNLLVDELIEKSMVELDPKIRLDDLQQIQKILIQEDVWGVPLFEYEKLYSFTEKIAITPRIDGVVYFDELIIK